MNLFEAVADSINLARPGMPDSQVAQMAMKLISTGSVHLNHERTQHYSRKLRPGDVLSYDDFLFGLERIVYKYGGKSDGATG